MLAIGNAGFGSGSTLSLDTRAAIGAGVLAANATGSSSSSDAGTPDVVTTALPDQQVSAVPRYNAFEFTYRSDYGKVILREQNVDTGQEVTQVPSEYRLQQYAATLRAQRVQQQAALYHVEHVSSQPRGGTGTKTGASPAVTGKPATVSAGSSVQSAPAVAPAPAPQAAAPAAPAVAPAAVTAAPAHVDIKV
jgi:hypothetical protein